MSAPRKKFGSAVVKCITCTKTVYPLEALTVESQVYHKRCFRCKHCDRVCGLGNFAMYQGTVYCKVHFLQLFRSRGTYDFESTDGADQPAFGQLRRNKSSNPEQEKQENEASVTAIEKHENNAIDSIASKVLNDDTINVEPVQNNVNMTSVKLKPAHSRVLNPHPSNSAAESANEFGKVTLRKTNSALLNSSQNSPINDLQADIQPDVVELPEAQNNSSSQILSPSIDEQTSDIPHDTEIVDDADNLFPSKAYDSEDDKLHLGDEDSNSGKAMNKLMSAISRRDSHTVQKALDGVGVGLLFEKGKDGRTPIEVAFATDSVECGRFLVDCIGNEIKSLKSLSF